MSATGGSTETDNLTEVQARERGANISKASYRLTLDFVKGANEYKGKLTAKFNYKKANGAEVFLDAITKTVHKLEVNNKEVTVDANVVKDNRIFLPSNLLQETNDVVISYTNAYDKNGNGLHHFVDPEDKQEYLYTNFEPFYAHRLLPCFDQPDIKGTIELEVIAPKEWVAVANDSELKATTLDDGRVSHLFKATPPLSTYLYALVVGPYDKYEDKYGSVPMAMYARKSLTKYLEPDLQELFTITKQGLKFYEDFYDYKYPFTKYDQIFCPEYNIGAMENPGCITYTERYIFRDPATDEQRLRRADTFLHEMAHMWFGDLVSPVWWDGLWLNESFASYMAALAIAESTRFGSKSWLEFHSSYKRWAYREDQLSTTHPIQGTVIDTNSTFQTFDGITYGKGASVLKQLVSVVSMEGFKAGMQHYFKKHPWGNTTIGDFLNAIEVGAKKPLKEWSKLWLETAGLNTLTPVWTAEGGNIKSFTIEQTAVAPTTTLRPHKLEVALFDAGADGAPVFRTSVLIDVNGASTNASALVGQKVPACLFINHNDHAYAKVALDPVSFAYLKDHVEKFPDNMFRQLVWSAFANMVRDAQVPPQEFLELVHKKASFETDPKLVQFIVRAAEGALGSFLPEEFKEEYSEKFFNFCLARLPEVKNSDDKIIWARALVRSAQSPKNVQQLLGFIDNGTGSYNFELDQDMRWGIVQAAASHAFPDSAARVDTEKARDGSDRGLRALEAIRASAPDPAVKATEWQKFLTDTTASMKMLNAAMGGFNTRHQKVVLAPYVNKFFEEIHNVFKTREFLFAENFYNILFPFYKVDEETLTKCETLLKGLDTEKDTALVRCVKESIDDIKRELACYALARKYAAEKK